MWLSKSRRTERKKVLEVEAKFEELTVELVHLRAEFEQARQVPYRERLQDTRDSVTHKFNVAGHERYITLGLYPDGRPAEVFINMAKEDSTVGGLMDAIGILTSLALQYGVPVENLARKFQHTRFEPSGHTTNPKLREVTSLVDYILTWLALFEECRTEAAANTPHTEGPLQ